MKIAVLGASVSAQKRNHQTGEITGYVEILRQDHQVELGVHEICQITYAGNRFSDGGMAQLHEILRYAPDICLFEPLIEDGTRGMATRLGEFRYAYRRLLTGGILPVTLLLPEPQRGSAASNPNYGLIRKICRELGLPEIEINLAGADIKTDFKGVHTRRSGAELYARQIAKGLRPHLAPQQRQALVAQAFEKAKRHPSHTFMRKVDLPANLPGQVTGLGFDLELATSDTQVRLVTKQQIGPFSPVLRVCTSPQEPPGDQVIQNVSVWDVFCHYPRDSFVVLANLTLPKGHHRLELATTSQDPAYASSRHQFDTPPPERRHLRPKGPIFVISNKPVTLHMTTYSTGYNQAGWASL